MPRATVTDWDAWPERLDTLRAGLLPVLPDLAALDLPALARQAGYPGTSVIPATSWLLSLLALSLTRTRRVSHAGDLLAGPAAALLAGLAILPGKSALTAYSYRTSRDHQRAFLAALDTKMIASGLAAAEEATFDLDFHAVMAWGRDPALEKHYVPARSQRARPVLTFFAQDSGTRNLVYGNAGISKATQAREAIAFCDHRKAVSGKDPAMLIMDQKVTTQDIVTGLGRDAPTVIITNDQRMRTRAIIGQYARADDHRTAARRDHPRLLRRRALQHRQPQRRPRHHARRPGPGPDRRVARPAARLRDRHPRHHPAPLPRNPGQVTTTPDTITIRLERRAYSPVLRKASLPAATTIPWLGNRTISYEFA